MVDYASENRFGLFEKGHLLLVGQIARCFPEVDKKTKTMAVSQIFCEVWQKEKCIDHHGVSLHCWVSECD